MKPLVLIAHEDSELLEGYIDALEEAGIGCLTARDGEDALATIASYQPHLAVLATELPSTQGTDVCLRLKHESSIAETKVILLGSDGSSGERFVGGEVGADRYLSTLPSSKQLVEEIVRLLPWCSRGKEEASGT